MIRIKGSTCMIFKYSSSNTTLPTPKNDGQGQLGLAECATFNFFNKSANIYRFEGDLYQYAFLDIHKIDDFKFQLGSLSEDVFIIGIEAQLTNFNKTTRETQIGNLAINSTAQFLSQDSILSSTSKIKVFKADYLAANVPQLQHELVFSD